MINDFVEASSSSEDEELINAQTLVSDSNKRIENEKKEIEKVLAIVKGVLFKIRSISRMSRKSNIIQNHVLKLVEEDPSLSRKSMFTLDFFIRWNSTFKMITRFKSLKKIVIALTSCPEEAEGITQRQIRNLKKFALTNQDWLIVDILENILNPFFKATEIISGRNYPTLPISHIVYASLKMHLGSFSASKEEKIIKKSLLDLLEFHFKNKLTKSQKDYTLVKII